jgi:peptidoglycan/LPS O-acetylase OafA/YrhL
VNYFNAFHHHPNTSIAHAWSLAVEEQFYLLWPVSFLWLSRRGRPMIVAGVTAAAIAAIVRRWLLLRGGADVAYLYNAFDTRFDNLAIGCVLALIVDYGSVVRAAEGAAAQAWFPCVTIALIIASRLGGSAPYHYSVGFTVDAVLVAILIVQLIQLADARMWSWLEHPATRYLGTISYPIYLYHQWGASVGRRVPISNRHAEFWAGVIATVLLATGSYFVIERPFLRLKQRFEPAR